MSSKPSGSRRPTLTVIIPAFNEERNIGPTIKAASEAVSRSRFDADFVIVDDGSTDGTGDAARAMQDSYPIKVITQPNRGRVPSRRTGLAAASGEFVLFLDSRVMLAPEGLAYVCDQIDQGELVWNGHLVIDTTNNPYAKFWKVVTYVAWADYLANPRTTSFTTENYDRYPKGTGCFLAPADLVRQGFDQLRSYYSDERNAADDTPTIRWIASQQPIHISPRFACTYTARTTLKGFVKQAFHRGTFFLDGHGRPESRFFPAVVIFYPLSLLAIATIIRKPAWAGSGLLAGIAAGAGLALAKGFDADEAISFATLAPVYAVAHGAGMWRGLAMLLANRAARNRP